MGFIFTKQNFKFVLFLQNPYFLENLQNFDSGSVFFFEKKRKGTRKEKIYTVLTFWDKFL
jgi:hypothetical protein